MRGKHENPGINGPALGMELVDELSDNTEVAARSSDPPEEVWILCGVGGPN
jgi:hypothetical protein